MIEMNPYYAHDSNVGPVFDVATWSRAKAWSMAVTALVFGVLITTALTLAWKPTLLLKKPPEVVKSFHKETLKLQKDHPWVAYAGTGVVGIVGLFALLGSCASLLDTITGDYYFRAGPGGISLRVPHGLDLSRFGLVFKKLELDLPLDRIADWTVVQHKRLGSMSRNTGNIMAFFKIKTVDGKREEFNLDCFREPAHVIHSKIGDAIQMTPARLGPAEHARPPRVSSSVSRTVQEKCEVIFDSLAELLDRPDNSSAVIFSHVEDGKFVQFASTDQALLFDLPRQALDESEYARAANYFARRVGDISQQAGTMPGNDATVAVASGFQVQVSDAEEAARLALEVFDEVYLLPSDFQLAVERL